MCGRFTLKARPETVREAVPGLITVPEIAPRYNIAPSQPVLMVAEPHIETARTARWGLVPSWSDDAAMGFRLINARSETVADKPAFRDAFRKRRALILADGFYEWEKRDGGHRIPFWFSFPDERPFAFAGLWEEWHGDDQGPLVTCTILTTRANPLLERIHDRMPVILQGEAMTAWIDPASPPEALHEFTHPLPEGDLVAREVSPKVNSPKHDAADCLEPAAPVARQGELWGDG